ncbi:YifB family Mg chelatase-like AAA ATPase [Desulfurispirillum indicum]|uniref:YifB family Mg chelatase-like AAA ATPase n=1 Tax=Desulfurispirillum indicum TaxID=936456 RepID=UPI001CFBEAF7|nr:YifB family Mg chelatase-like AAA ATPase [Desulfurispirillum indicum]UCZ55793.1 YifB family Mg chelatase-like AAA ATPase [Desulfurispirillum indicum]
MVTLLPSCALHGIEAQAVEIQVSSSQGMLPSIVITGLPDTSVKESKDRIDAAIRSIGERIPPRRITINLSPADRKKSGTHFDFAIAVALLMQTGKIPKQQDNVKTTFLGELGLDGSLLLGRQVNGLLIACQELGIERVFLPRSASEHIHFVPQIEVLLVDTLFHALEVLRGQVAPEALAVEECQDSLHAPADTRLDFCHIQGQHLAVQSALIAAAGHHNLLLCGPPGIGKSMIAEALPGILPPLTYGEYLEVLKVYSVSGEHYASSRPPYRSPHASTSEVALIGGGTHATPGEISLAHRGVLLLDEMPEFRRKSLEALRQPLESGTVQISRAAQKQSYPAGFLLIGTMNLCPCGKSGHDDDSCTCSEYDKERYLAKLSAPVLDRIDLHVTMQREHGARAHASTAIMAEHVLLCRQRQMHRQQCLNGRLQGEALSEHCQLRGELAQTLQTAARTYDLSLRGQDRVLRVARTIADLSGAPHIDRSALLQALHYRPKVKI